MIVPVMAISNLVLTRQIYSEETNGAHAHNRDRVPFLTRSSFRTFHGVIHELLTRVRISERDNSNPGIKTLLPFLTFSEKYYGRGRFGGFSRSHNACYWFHKAISMGLS